VLIGNAAHQLHPVAGQGFNLGLRDAVILADALMTKPVDIGTVLKTYAKHRQLDQALITGFTDNVIKLFSTNSALFSVVRNSGLLMLDKIPMIKNQFARQTMGLGSRLARLKKVG
jgi:2-octaprenyl-6-methoxyphenol hydroxylase